MGVKTMLIKLTDQEGYTRRDEIGQTKWSPGFTLNTSGEGELCGPGYVHAYTDVLLALFLNPIHANIKNPLGWDAEGVVAKTDCGLKVGCTSLTVLRAIVLPEITLQQHIAFGILATKHVYTECKWSAWATDWLNGVDRTSYTAHVAYAAVHTAYAASHAANAAAYAASHAASLCVIGFDLARIAKEAADWR